MIGGNTWVWDGAIVSWSNFPSTLFLLRTCWNTFPSSFDRGCLDFSIVMGWCSRWCVIYRMRVGDGCWWGVVVNFWDICWYRFLSFALPIPAIKGYSWFWCLSWLFRWHYSMRLFPVGSCNCTSVLPSPSLPSREKGSFRADICNAGCAGERQWRDCPCRGSLWRRERGSYVVRGGRSSPLSLRRRFLCVWDSGRQVCL